MGVRKGEGNGFKDNDYSRNWVAPMVVGSDVTIGTVVYVTGFSLRKKGQPRASTSINVNYHLSLCVKCPK